MTTAARTGRSGRRTALQAAQVAAGEPLVLQGRGAWQANAVAMGASTVAYLGLDEASRDRIRAEQVRLRWAAAAGVPVPRVLAMAPDAAWLVVERVADDERYGPAYVRAAVEAARRVAAAGPPPAEAGAARSRRGRRTDLLLRVARAALSPLPVREFRALRSAAAALTASREQVTSHGDFHIGNVLSSGGVAVTVVDFEFLGVGHPADDLMSLWVDLEDEADRALLLELACATVGAPRADILLMAHWLALRHLAELVTGVPLRKRDRPEVRRAVERVREARALRAATGAAPG